ncbi:ATP adenylyltransferase family protein [Phormidesmis priestleyi]
MAEGEPDQKKLSGTLWNRVIEQTQHAIACGALLSIPTDYEFIEQGNVRFLVRVLSNIVRKDAAKKQEKENAQTNAEVNPFLPYEEDLFVADLSETHLCLLNKFNVVDHHLLIITKKFEEQESLLNQQDFAATWKCLSEINGLIFYNAGKNAGASQRHKHLQLVPFPLTPEGVSIPISPLLASIVTQAITTIPKLPFAHAFIKLPAIQSDQTLLDCYYQLLEAVSLRRDRPSGAYNLLATRDWMLMVPRSRESFQSISVNSLGFAGTLFVRDEQQMQVLRQHSPMEVLRQVGFGLAQ